MLSTIRFSRELVSRALGISALIAILFVAGCTSNGSSAQFGVTTTSTQLVAGIVGTAYPGATLTAANGTAPYSWTSTGNLDGLSLSGGGVLSGTPTNSGAFPFTVMVTDSATPPHTASASLTLTVNQAPAITSGNSATFTVGSAGTFTATATGFPAPTFTETGALPSGVTLNATTGVLGGTPAAGTGKTYPITITAQNGIGTNATQSFTLTVNQASAITSQSSISFVSGALGTFTVAATGFPAPTLSETGALPAGVTFNTATGVLGGTASGAPGNYPIVFTAQNGIGANATQNFTLTVGAAPAITSGNSTTFTVGSVGTFTATATGFPAPTFTETGALPTGVTLNSTTGVLSGTPAAGTGKTYPITITAQNGVGTNATQSFTLTVNQAPAITSGSSNTFIVGTAGTFTIMATGFPAPTFSETGALPTGVTLNTTTGVLGGTPASGMQGTYNIVISAQNGVGAVATQNFTLTVDLAPSITSGNSTTFTVGSVGTFTATATGFPAPTFTETGALPTGVTLNSTTGVLSGTPGTGTGKTYPITITAQNGVGASATQSFTLTVDQAPAITSGNTTTFAVGSASSFTVTASGFPAPTFSETGTLPSGLSFNTTTGVLSGTPASGTQNSSPYSITFTALNGVGTNATQSFTLVVSFTAPPSFTSSNSTTFTVGTLGTFTATATGSPAPTFSETGALPSGVTLNTTTGVLSGTPGAGTGGSYPITLTAQNGITPNATQPFTLTVDQSPTITSLNNATFTVGVNGSFTVTTTGNPAPALSVTSGTLPSPITFTDNHDGTATISGTATGASVNPITITANNGVGSNATQSFTLTVTAVSCTTNCTISGHVIGPWVSGLTIGLTGPASASTTTDPTGFYSFTGLAGGTYTVTPSPLAGYTFSPSAPAVPTSASTTTQDFTETSAVASFSISGTISYAGAKTGNTIIRVFQSGCTNCGVVAGTSFSTKPSASGTAYIIRGLPAASGGGGSNGSYVVSAEIDTLGTGILNESNPEGTSGTVNITTTDITGVNFTVVDRAPSAAVKPTKVGVAPGNGAAVVQYKNPEDSNGEEIATSYKVYYGTDSNATNGVGSPRTFKAQGHGADIFILKGLANGLTFFKVSAVNSTGESAATTPVSATLAAGSGANTVSGTVTFPGTATGHTLYVGAYGDNGIFFQPITSPVSPQAYSFSGVPSGTYQNFAILDLNDDGEVNPPDLSDVTNHSNPPTITVSGNATGNIILANVPAIVGVPTSVFGSSGQPNSYGISVQVDYGTKLPVSMILFSGKNVAVPYDMNADSHNANYNPIYVNSVSPTVGDAYQFLVTFSDGSTQVVTSTVTAVLTSFAQNLAMQTTSPGSPTVPLLTWTAPAVLPTIVPYTYSVNLYNNSGTSQEFWNYYGSGNGNGIPSTQTNALFDTDGSANPSSSLTVGGSYNWSVFVQDNDNNQCVFTTTYVVP